MTFLFSGLFILLGLSIVFVSFFSIKQQQEQRTQASVKANQNIGIVISSEVKRGGTPQYTQGELLLLQRLRAKGYTVYFLKDTQLSSAIINQYHLFIISSTADPAKAGFLKFTHRPLLVMNTAALPNLNMVEAAAQPQTREAAPSIRNGRIVAPPTQPSAASGSKVFNGSLNVSAQHQLANNQTGSIKVAMAPSARTILKVQWATPRDTAIKVANVGTDHVYFAYEKNAVLADQLFSPARRVSFFADETLVPYFTTQGWSMFDNAIVWALAGQTPTATPTPTSTPRPTVFPSSTPRPTLFPSPTPRPTLFPSPTPKPTLFPSPSPTPLSGIPKSISWTQLADYAPDLEGYGKQEGQGGMVNGKLYLLGGYDNEYRGVQRSDVYTVSSNSWSQIAPVPEKLNHAAYVQDGDTLYLLGGFVGDNPTNNSTANVWKYRISQNSWSAGVPLPDSRGASVAVKYGRNIHFVGGVFRANGIYDDKADHYVFNLDSQQWSRAADLPTPRNHPGATVIGNKMYVIGGQVGHKEETGNIGTVEAYDFKTNTWESLPDMPSPRGHILASTLAKGPFVFVVGGSENGVPSRSSSAVSVLDTRNNKWHILTTLPAGRKSVVAGFVGDDLYVATGHGQGFAQKTTWRGRVNY